MVAVIGYPGESKHTWKRFTTKAEAIAWLNAKGAELAEEHPAWAHTAVSSQRIISEREASRIRYRDGRKVYPQGAITEHYAEM